MTMVRKRHFLLLGILCLVPDIAIGVPCPYPDVPASLHPLICTDGLNVGSKCYGICIDGFYTNEQLNFTCLPSGSWSKAVGDPCVKRICEKPKRIGHAFKQISCSDDYNFGSRCIAGCQPGYSSNTENHTGVCKHRQDINRPHLFKMTWSWSTTLTSCQAISCGKIHYPLNGASNCSGLQRYPTVCTYHCFDGFELPPGTETTVKCPITGEWTAEVLDCTPKKCPSPIPSAQNTIRTCTADVDFGSKCTYTCTAGFDPVPGGYYESECVYTTTLTGVEKMAWSVTPTSCQVKVPPSCPPLQTPPSTDPNYSCSDCFKTGSTCTVVCQRGYSLPTGVTNVVTCKDDSSWDKPVESCTKRSCPPVPVPTNAKPAVCTDDSLFGSTCSFECQSGYYLPAGGVSKTECTYTAGEKSTEMNWDNVATACLEDACEAFVPPTNGRMTGCTNSFKYMSKCTVVCNPGFSTATLNTEMYVMTCKGMANGWDMQVIACQPSLLTYQMGEAIDEPVPIVKVTVCPKPYFVANVQNTTNCTDDYNAGSVCEFTCNNGYALPNNELNAVKCLDTLTWDRVATPCIRQPCVALVVPANAETPSCTNGFNYESVCTIRCENGYVGLSKVTCLASGQWDAQPETCQKRVCEAPIPSQYSDMLPCTQNYEFGSVCTFECRPGYQLSKGSIAELECIAVRDSLAANMTWSADVPHCEAAKCGKPPAQENAHMQICSDSFNYLSTCRFSCDLGSESVGSEDILLTCGTTNGKLAWNKQSDVKCEALPTVYPDCQPLVITPVYNVEEAACKAPYKTGAKCAFNCLPGYVRPKNSKGTVTCMKTGNWDQLPVACEKKKCDPVLTLPNSEAFCTEENKYESECTYTCKPGYHLPPNSSVTTTCQASGKWSRIPDDCVASACLPPNLDNNQREDTCSNDYVFLSTCSFKCKDGFVLPDGGQDTAKCVSIVYAGNGSQSITWSEIPTPCTRRLCNSPLMPLNGHLRDCTGFKYESHCIINCQTGYSLVDSAADKIQCSAKANKMQWTAADPGCKVSECDPIAVPKNTVLVGCTDGNNYLSECTLKCSPGHHYDSFDEINVLICTESKFWTAEPSPCLKSKCHAPFVPNNAKLISCSDEHNFGSVCVFNCSFGYHKPKAWSDKVTCTAKQTWDFVNVACLPNTCSKPTLLQHVELGCCSDAYNYASECDINCAPGYMLTDRKNGVIACNADGTWSNENATCESVRCEKPTVPAHAKLSECDAGTEYMSTCTFICDDGYHMPCYGVSEITCEKNALWNREPSPCVINSCPAPALTGKYYESRCTDKYNAGSKCDFNCEFGHEWPQTANPVKTITCQKDSRWSDDLPTCVPKQCSRPIPPKNSRLIACSHGYTFLSECEFQCLPGYHVTGVPVMICQASTFWTSAAFVCQLNTCPPIRIPAHATSTNCTAGDNFSSECTVQCDPGFRIAEPNNEQAMCGTGSNWDQELSPCIEIDECESSPCQHGGQCVNLINGYECVCDFSKAGDDCGTNLCKCKNCVGKDCAIPDEYCVEGDCILDAVLVAIAFTIIALSMLVMVILRMKIEPRRALSCEYKVMPEQQQQQQQQQQQEEEEEQQQQTEDEIKM